MTESSTTVAFACLRAFAAAFERRCLAGADSYGDAGGRRHDPVAQDMAATAVTYDQVKAKAQCGLACSRILPVEN
jgi:hypothetical protein